MLVHAAPPSISSISSMPSTSSSVVSVVSAPSAMQPHASGCISCCSQHFALGCRLLNSLVSPLPAQELVVAQSLVPSPQTPHSSVISSSVHPPHRARVYRPVTPRSTVSSPDRACSTHVPSLLPPSAMIQSAHTCPHCHARLSNVWPTGSAAPTTINIVASAGRQLASQCLT
jgi:hypothetical protein